MEIRLHRKYLKKGYSIGILSINGKRICETLEDTDRGLAIWRTLEDFSSGAVCLVLASDLFDEDDYIYEYDDFLKYAACSR